MKHVIHNVMVWFTWQMINREHFLIQKHNKNVESTCNESGCWGHIPVVGIAHFF